MGKLLVLVFCGILVPAAFGRILNDADECSSYNKCENLLTAKRCNAVDYCIRFQWTFYDAETLIDKDCENWVKNVRNLPLLLNDDIKSLKYACTKYEAEICEEFVETNVLELRKLIESEMNESSVCSVLMRIYDIESTEIAFPRKFTLKNLGIGCFVCRTIMQATNDLIGNVHTEEFIRETLGAICFKFWLFAFSCRMFVSNHITVLIIDILNNLTSSQICSKLMGCSTVSFPDNFMIEPASSMNQLIITYKDEIKDENLNFEGKFKCKICAKLVNALQKSVQGKPHKNLKKVCNQLPAKRLCKKFIDKYGEKLSKLLSEKVTPDKICARLMSCKRPKTDCMEMENEIDEELSSLIFGGLYLVRNVFATAFKQQFNFDLQVHSSCFWCNKLVGYVEDLNKANNKKDILFELYKICDTLEAKTECKEFVEKYGEKAADIMLMGQTTSEVCHELFNCEQF